MLKRERPAPVERQCESRLEEHAQLWVLVVVDQAEDGGRAVHARVVRVEAEPVVPLLDSRVERAIVASETHTEEVLLLGRVSQQECAVWPVLEQAFRFVAIHLAPIERAFRNVEQIGDETV